jgi:hypothetical protein
MSGVGVIPWWGEGGQPDRPTLLREQARHDVAVAAVIARPGQDQYPTATNMTLDGTGHGAPCRLHQDGTRVPMMGGGSVSLAHLNRGEQFGSAAEAADQVRIEGQDGRVG